jgi:2-polyprenyl-6-methoxyphenol hydroxylase-like FAD-dependent oxidoreductase
MELKIHQDSKIQPSMSISPIVIAGAGIAGLTLGRCLKQKNIPTLIIEKFSSPPRNNYGITLHPWAYRPLLAALHMDESTFRDMLSVDTNRGGSGAIAGDLMSTSIDTTSGTFRCHRGRFERLLREGQDIRWGHTIEDIEIFPGKIKVIIIREAPIESKILIGADGVHSQVRKSLAPYMQVKVLPYVVFNGSRKMAVHEYKRTIRPQMQGYTIIQSRRDDVVLQICVNDFSTEGVDVGYTYSRPARQNDPLHNPDRPITGATDIPEAFYVELGDLKELGQAFAEIFNAGRVRKDRVLHWLMRSSLGTKDYIQDLADQGILLVGDAIHAMPILGGEGANTAMEDGVELADHIIVHGPQSIKSYSAERYEVWQRRVEQSEERLADMNGAAKATL